MNEDEDGRTNNRDGVERQVHHVADNSLGAELLKGALDDLAKFLHRICPRLDLSSLAHDLGISTGKERTIKHIEKGILKEVVARHKVDDGGTLIENQQNRREGRNRAIDEE